MSSDEDDNLNNAMFQEPDDYFQPEEPYTHTDYTLLSGQKLRLRLVGHNPLATTSGTAAKSSPPTSNSMPPP